MAKQFKLIYVIRKYILADSLKEAVGLDSKTPVHDAWLQEDSQKAWIERLGGDKENMGFKHDKK